MKVLCYQHFNQVVSTYVATIKYISLHQQQMPKQVLPVYTILFYTNFTYLVITHFDLYNLLCTVCTLQLHNIMYLDFCSYVPYADDNKLRIPNLYN